jgi:thiol-disulfide isomerase/thioredoxin
MNPLLLAFFLALPPTDIQDVDGAELIQQVKQSEEPLVVINVWATWCAPCVRELPMLFKVEKEFAGKVRFMFVSADFKSERDQAAKLITAKGARTPGYFRRGGDQPFIESLHPDWNGALPATFVFDRGGKRLRFWQGELQEHVLSGALANLLTAPAAR